MISSHRSDPADPRARRCRPWVGLALLVATLLALAVTVAVSLDPDHYFFYGHEDRSEWVHPTGHVAFVCSFVALEGLLVGVALAGPWRRRYLAALVALGVLVPWSILSGFAIIHMPSYVILHLLWVLALVFLLFAALVFFAGRALWRWNEREASRSVGGGEPVPASKSDVDGG